MRLHSFSFGLACLICAFLFTACSALPYRYHEVSNQSETIERVAVRYDVPLPELLEYNPQVRHRGLIAGEKLYIPYEESLTWKSKYGEWFGVPTDGANLRSYPREVSSQMPKFSWPVLGYVSSNFGRRWGAYHEGIDIPARKGTPVRSARSGHVIYAGNRIPGYGNLVIIRHADRFSTVYAHLSKIEVRKGQFATRGHRIGRVGATGRANGPHLHFEIREGQRPIDPLFFLQRKLANNILGRRKRS